MSTSLILENSVTLSLSESWEPVCTVMSDVPLSMAYWRLAEISGENFLEELPVLRVKIPQTTNIQN